MTHVPEPINAGLKSMRRCFGAGAAALALATVPSVHASPGEAASRTDASTTSQTPRIEAASHAAAEDDSKPLSIKFTTGLYQVSGGGQPAGPGLDLNLRASGGPIGDGDAWIGVYRSAVQGVTQARAGWDTTYDMGPVRFVPSLQIASGGFVGGSIYAESGDSWFAGAGLGRTNLRPYVNLNFDPNDAWTLAGGYRWADKRSLTLQAVHDNRQNPDQRHVHLVYRTPTDHGGRLTLDLLDKQGTVDGAQVHRIGLAVGYDWPHTFVRVAWDPLVNFTPQNMLRVSGGLRF
jgi:hypothetical protein